MSSLTIKNLSFGYDHPILQNISFRANSGEFIGILGPNGCGKSTLAKNILKILSPQKGSIAFDGEDFQSLDSKMIAKLIGFVPQRFALNMPLSVEDVLLMGRYSHMKHSFSGYTQEDRSMMIKIAKSLNVDCFLHRSALSLSGGELQRVLLARALIGDPKILLLDEPTSALDINHALEMMKICQSYIQTQHKIALVIIHDLNLAALFCKRLILMNKGAIYRDGSIEEVLQPEILKAVYGFECDVITHNAHPYILIKA